MLLPLFHLSVVTLNLFTFWYDQKYVDLPLPSKEFEQMPFKGRYIFFTLWSLALYTVYFTVALLNDLIGSNDPAPRNPPLIRTIKDIFFSLAFTMGVYGSVSFWSISYIDKTLLISEEMKRALPDWINHVWHTFVSVFVVIELLISNKTYPSRKIGIALIVTYTTSYSVWMHVLFHRTGTWVYPLFKDLNVVSKIGYSLVVFVIVISTYIAGEKLNVLLSRSSGKSESKKLKAKRR